MHVQYIMARAAVALETVVGLVLVYACSGCGQADPLPAEDPNRQKLQLRSSAFGDGGIIPKKFSCDGADSSPPLQWSQVPSSANSLVLIVDDPDATMGIWSHWVVFNLPPQVNGLKQEVPPEETIAPAYFEGLDSSGEVKLTAIQGQNDFGKHGYGGPCPPGGTHRYFFRLYALDVVLLHLSSDATRADVLKAVSGHILAEGRLLGEYQRSRSK